MPARDFYRQLYVVANRLRLVRQRRAIVRAACIVTMMGIACCGLMWLVPGFQFPLQLLALLGAGVVFVIAWKAFHQFDDFSEAVRQLEAHFPDLQTRLLTAVEQQPDGNTGRFTLLQQRLLENVTLHAQNHDWPELVSPQSLRQCWWRQVLALTALVVVVAGLMAFPGDSTSETVSTKNVESLEITTTTIDYTVDPGDTQVERNQSLLILLRCSNETPREVELIWQPDHSSPQRMAMTKSLDDPIFAGRIPNISSNGTYSLEFAGVTTPGYRVDVFDLPTLLSSTFTIEAPSYTNREAQVLESATSVTLIEGAQLRLECRVNKRLAKVELRDQKDQRVVELTPLEEDPLRYQVTWRPDQTRQWELVLIDDEERTNRDPEIFSIDVIPNRRPDLKPVFPAQDQRVSPLQEITLETKTSDDFGILSTGILLDTGDGTSKTISISGPLAGGEAHAITHLLALEDYGVSPGEIVSFAFFAEDFGPDGQPRQTIGDLFFLEIRPFEETFREMEGAGGQSNLQGASNSSGQAFEKLIELQKQIVSATWNLYRRDPDLTQVEEQSVVETLRESQISARQQFDKLRMALEGNVPMERIDAVSEPMSRAIEEFTQIKDATSEPKSHLAMALPSVRSAFQGLIRLKPTDHRIMQGGQSGAGGGGGSMSQQQLEQLELSEDANRYETEKTVREADASPQKEQLAILNRLKELAQRQQGLNEKLKELDAELRTAQNDAEKDELERQLKQLRDEQQDLLQDADALRNRMQQSSDPSQTAETRKQLEATRQQLVDAAESLEEGKLSQALNSGTRAERDLQKMQEDFRKQTSAQLTESLQNLRNQIQELTTNEDKIADDLARLSDPNQKSLRQRQDRQRVAESLQEQHQQLEQALKAVREFVQEAETSEPLASKRLYEAARNTQQQKTEEALDAAAKLVQRGFLPEAMQVEQLARTGLKTLQEGIDAAVESILGDEVESLKRAKRELADLTQELQRELQAARDEPSDSASATSASTSPSEEGTDNSSEENSSGVTSPAETPSENNNGTGNSSNDSGTPSPSGKSGGLRGGKQRQSQSKGSPGPGSSQPANQEGGQGGGPGGQGGPITGGNYTDWSERLRDVETLLQDPELQAEVAKVREHARGMRAEFKRHSQLPNWELVEDDVQKPLVELQRRLAEEIAKRESPDALVPTDRDPVPDRYQELVRKYYERLGSGSK